MSIKNSIKILLNNFSVVWKILVYQIIVIAISLALIASFVMPNIYTIYNSVKGTGLLHNAKEVINTFLERGDLTLSIEAFKTSLEEVSSILTEYDSLLILSMLFVLAIVVFGNLLSGMSELPVSDMINADMSANAKYGFCSRYIITLGKNLKYQLVRLITEIPAFLIIAFAVWQSFLFLFGYIGIFALFFCFALFVVLLSFSAGFSVPVGARNHGKQGQYICLNKKRLFKNKTKIFFSRFGIRVYRYIFIFYEYYARLFHLRRGAARQHTYERAVYNNFPHGDILRRIRLKILYRQKHDNISQRLYLE